MGWAARERFFWEMEVYSPEEAPAVGVLPALGLGEGPWQRAGESGVRLGISTYFLWPVLPLSLAGRSSKRPQRGGSPCPLAPALTGTHQNSRTACPGPGWGTFGSQSHGEEAALVWLQGFPMPQTTLSPWVAAR